MSQSWSNKVVVIAGGSSGLGLSIARAFAKQGASVVLLARRHEPLEIAVKAVMPIATGNVDAIAVDAGDATAIAQVAIQIESRLGRIDAWVNVIGKSIRKPVTSCTPEDFESLMNINFLTAVHGTYAALSALEKTDGHLVFIGSLASKTAWPFVGPYAASKHALAAFAQQIRIEGPSNIHCLHVCPGPIAREDAGERYRDQAEDLAESANRPGAGAPVKLIDPDRLAERIVRACERRSPEIITSFKTKILVTVSHWWPSLGDRLIRKFGKKKT